MRKIACQNHRKIAWKEQQKTKTKLIFPCLFQSPNCSLIQENTNKPKSIWFLFFVALFMRFCAILRDFAVVLTCDFAQSNSQRFFIFCRGLLAYSNKVTSKLFGYFIAAKYFLLALMFPRFQNVCLSILTVVFVCVTCALCTSIFFVIFKFFSDLFFWFFCFVLFWKENELKNKLKKNK